MNAQVKRKPTKTRLNAAVNPVAEAVQTIALHDAQTIIFKMDKAIEDLTMQRDQFDHAATELNNMLTDAHIECDRLRGELAENNAMDLLQRNGMLHADNKQIRARLECVKADLAAAQNKVKRLEHSAERWEVLWVRADRTLSKSQNLVWFLTCVIAAMVALVVVLAVWGAL